MIKEFLKFALDHDLIIPGRGVVVACSGGPDSMALLDLTDLVRDELAVKAAVAHLNHSLRGGAAQEDEDFVVAEGVRRGMPVIVRRLEPGWEKRLQGESWETAARRLRREFLRETALDLEAPRVLLGHTADDLSETVFFRILRGTGPDGLVGIPPLTDNLFAHPLLPFTRDQILKHLEIRGIPRRQDATNLDPTTTRNRLRLEVLPELGKTFNPSLKKGLVRLASLALDDRDYFESEVDRRWEAAVSGDPPVLDLEILNTFPPPIRWRLLQRYLASVAGVSIPTTVLAEGLAMISVPGSRPRLRLPGGAVVEKAYGIMRPAEAEPTQAEWEVRINGPGRFPLPDGRVLVLTEPGGKEGLAPAIVAEGLTARGRKPGDRFRLSRTGLSVRLKKVLNQRRIPLSDRGRLVLLAADRGIAWVEGIGLSSWARSGEGLPIEIEPSKE